MKDSFIKTLLWAVIVTPSMGSAEVLDKCSSIANEWDEGTGSYVLVSLDETWRNVVGVSLIYTFFFLFVFCILSRMQKQGFSRWVKYLTPLLLIAPAIFEVINWLPTSFSHNFPCRSVSLLQEIDPTYALALYTLGATVSLTPLVAWLLTKKFTKMPKSI